MQKWIVKFLRKFENRGIKIARLNSILINKSINLQLFAFILYGVGVRCDVDIFKRTSSAQCINGEVYGGLKLHKYLTGGLQYYTKVLILN